MNNLRDGVQIGLSISRCRSLGYLIICLTMSNTILGSTLAYLDSYSLVTWHSSTNVGPASAVITGSEGLKHINEIRAIPGVTKAAYLHSAWAMIYAYPLHHNRTPSSGFLVSGDPLDPELNTTTRAACLGPDFTEMFGSIMNLTTGRYPENVSEIAVVDWVADRYHVGPGDIVEYVFQQEATKRILELVGVYRLGATDNQVSYYYTSAYAVVPFELIGDRGREDYVYLDVERKHISAFWPSRSLHYLREIDESIRQLDPRYLERHVTGFFVDNLLLKGIESYSNWLNSARLTQLIRIQSFLFVGVLVMIQGLLIFMKHHNRRIKTLESRGASSRQIMGLAYKEVLTIAVTAIVPSIGLSILFDEIGLMIGSLAQRGAFEIQLGILVSLDSIFALILYGVIAPCVVLGAFLIPPFLAGQSDSSNSGISRIPMNLKRVQWDVALVVCSFLLVVGISQAPTAIKSSLIATLIIRIAPYVAVIALGDFVTKELGRPLGKISSFLRGRGLASKRIVGIRSVQTQKIQAGLAILILMLSTSLIWNNAILDTTLDHTILNQTRFAIGGDIAFSLRKSQSNLWDDILVVSENHPDIQSASLISVYGLSLSTELQEKLEFVAVDPLDYAYTGYDAQGIGLESSYLMDYLEELHTILNGAVLTQDIAASYGVYEGDTLNAFRRNGSLIETLTFVILGVVSELPDSMVSVHGYYPPIKSQYSGRIGRGRIWINRALAQSQLGSGDISNGYICARTEDTANGSAARRDIIENTGSAADAISGSAAAFEIVKEHTESERYMLDRSVHTMLSVLTFILIPITLVTYTVSTRQQRIRETALLKSLGAGKREVLGYNLTQMLTLSFYSSMLLLITTPIMISNGIELLILSSGIALASFPYPIILVIPWSILLGMLFAVFMTATVVALALSAFEMNMPLSTIAHLAWDETQQKGRLF